MSAIASFLQLVDIYCAAAGCAEATLSTRLLGDGKRIAAIRGGADIGARRMARAVEWFSDNWPIGAVWPERLPRPTSSDLDTPASEVAA